MSRKLSIRDIAVKAGLSVASVSNVLNGKTAKVSAETAQRVLNLVRELDYQPNMSARSLSSGRSQLIGLVFPITVADEKEVNLIGENPFYGEFFDGVESVLRSRSYDVILAGFRPDEDYSDWVRRRGLDGVILLGKFSKQMLERLQAGGVAIMLTDTEDDFRASFSCVGIDDEEGAWLATRHLIDLGWRRIALAGGNTASSHVNRLREQGYKRALMEAGISIDVSLLYEDNVSLGGGMRIAERILASSHRPEAIFAVADTVAAGIISTYLSHGLRIPRDCSVIGFDDVALFSHLHPGITTIRQDVRGKGRMAAIELLRLLSGEDVSPRYVKMPLSLVRRGSTMPA